MKRVDWVKARLDFVNNPTLELKDIAARHGATEAAVGQRAHREQWTEARAARSQMVSNAVIRKTVSANAAELAKWNEDDVKVAKALRNAAVRKLQEAQRASEGIDIDGKAKEFPLEPGEIRSLGMAFQCAQQIARLALGASTTNISDQTLDPIANFNLENLSDEQLTTFEQNYQSLIARTFGSNSERATQASGSQVQ